MIVDAYRGPQPLRVDADDASGWARTYHVLREGRAASEAWNRSYHVLREGRAASEAWNRSYLERNNLVERVERLDREGVGVRREPRADGEDGDDE